MGGLAERLERLHALRTRGLSGVLKAFPPTCEQIFESAADGLSKVLRVTPPACGQIRETFSSRPRVECWGIYPPPVSPFTPPVGDENLGIPGKGTLQNPQKVGPSPFRRRPRPKTLPPPREANPQNPQKPLLPVWHDLDDWRSRWREAPDVAARREVLAAWAAAAGGEVADGALHLPPGLPGRLARAEMTANASYVDLAIAELLPPRCAGCPNSPIPGDSLCDHCLWLAGPAPTGGLRAEPIPRAEELSR